MVISDELLIYLPRKPAWLNMLRARKIPKIKRNGQAQARDLRMNDVARP